MRSYDPPPSPTKSPPLDGATEATGATGRGVGYEAAAAAATTAGPANRRKNHHRQNPVSQISRTSGSGHDVVVEIDIDASHINNPNPYKNDLTERRNEFIRECLKTTYVYEISSMIRDYYVVNRVTYPSQSVTNELLNSSIKTNILYGTYSGIWKFCNYLSRKCH